jgi:hypothetical protein
MPIPEDDLTVPLQLLGQTLTESFLTSGYLEIPTPFFLQGETLQGVSASSICTSHQEEGRLLIAMTSKRHSPFLRAN